MNAQPTLSVSDNTRDRIRAFMHSMRPLRGVADLIDSDAYQYGRALLERSWTRQRAQKTRGCGSLPRNSEERGVPVGHYADRLGGGELKQLVCRGENLPSIHPYSDSAISGHGYTDCIHDYNFSRHRDSKLISGRNQTTFCKDESYEKQEAVLESSPTNICS